MILTVCACNLYDVSGSNCQIQSLSHSQISDRPTTRDSRASGNMQYPSTQLAVVNSEQRSNPLANVTGSNSGVGIGLVAVMLVSTVAFITECTGDSRFRQLFRLNSLFRTRHSNVVLQPCFLPLVFVPIPVCLRSFRLFPGSARQMTSGHVPWPALRLNKRFGVACPSFTAFACAHHQWCHSDRQVEGRHPYPLGPFNNA